MKPLHSLAAFAIAATFSIASPALAHPQLVTASPAQASAARNVTRISLTFSEPLIAQLSGLEVVMTGMPGMSHAGSHGAMKMTGVRVSVGPGGKTLIATLARPLPIGGYDVNWHAVSTDTHRVTGKLSFTVH